MRSCGGRGSLEQFLGGVLSAAASAAVAAHVETCTTCQAVLDELTNEAPDLWCSALAPAEEDDPVEPAPEFLERLRRSVPAAVPPEVLLRWSRDGNGSQAGHESGVRPNVDGVARHPMAVPGYEILGELSRGGMGVVYRARQIGLNRLVALKMIHAGARASDADRARFHNEAQAVARLHHPNIVQIYDIGECEGCPYFTMELVNGPTLAHACQGRPQPARLAATLVETLARAVACAHEHGILHRDLKPANVLLEPVGAQTGPAPDGEADIRAQSIASISTSISTPKLADFGLAKRLDDVSLTQNGRILGTPSYMAPEQVDGNGRALGPAVDIYALGAILYELLTGRPPFISGSIESTLAILASEDPIAPRRLQPDVPRDLETISLKCLEKEPARRYLSAAGLADDLARFLSEEPVLARPPSAFDRSAKFARRNRAAFWGAAAVMTALALGIAATTVMAMRESHARRRADQNAMQARAAQTAARREAYQARLAAALAAINDHDVMEADRQLGLAPREERGWEWQHIHGKLDQSLAVVAGLPREGVAFCSPGRRLAVADGRGYRLLSAWSGERVSVRATDSPCRQVFAFMTSLGPRFVIIQSDVTLSLVLTDDGGLTLARVTLPSRIVPADGSNPLVIALSSDTTRIALRRKQSAAPSVIDVFDMSTGQSTATCVTPEATLMGLDFSPDGTRLAAALESSQLFVFNSATGKKFATLSGHTGSLRAVTYSPDGRRLASCGDDQTIRVWDTETGRTECTLRGHAGRVVCAAFSPDSRRLVTGASDNTLRLWNADGGDAVLVLHGHTGTVNHVAFSVDGRTIASAASDGTARLWDATSVHDASVLRGHTSYVYPVAYSPDGRWIASGSWDGSVRLWDAATGTLASRRQEHGQPVGALAFAPDATHLASWGEDGTIRVCDLATGRSTLTLQHTRMGHRDSVYTLLVSPDGRRLCAATKHGARVWSLPTGADLPQLSIPLDDVRVLAFSPDGRRIAAGGSDPRVVILDATSGAPCTELSGFEGRIQSVAFSPDGRKVLTAGKDARLRLWDAASGRLIKTLTGHSMEVLSAVFSPDGTRIASAGHDRSILVWDVASGLELVRLPGHSWYVFSLAFSPDGATLVSGSGDTTVRLWDAFPVARRLQARRAR